MPFTFANMFSSTKSTKKTPASSIRSVSTVTSGDSSSTYSYSPVRNAPKEREPGSWRKDRDIMQGLEYPYSKGLVSVSTCFIFCARSIRS